MGFGMFTMTIEIYFLGKPIKVPYELVLMTDRDVRSVTTKVVSISNPNSEIRAMLMAAGGVSCPGDPFFALRDVIRAILTFLKVFLCETSHWSASLHRHPFSGDRLSDHSCPRYSERKRDDDLLLFGYCLFFQPFSKPLHPYAPLLMLFGKWHLQPYSRFAVVRRHISVASCLPSLSFASWASQSNDWKVSPGQALSFELPFQRLGSEPNGLSEECAVIVKAFSHSIFRFVQNHTFTR